MSGSDQGARKVLKGFLREDSHVHALLLYGSEGAPLKALAAWMAQGWLCLAPIEGAGCGECKSCRAFQNENHVDLLTIKPGGASSLIKINVIAQRDEPESEKVSSLQEFFRTPPLSGKRKVAVIEDADRMTGEASNALLKSLEEPHGYAKIVLTTRSFGSVLATIVSRCVSVPCESSMDEVEEGEATLAIRGLAHSLGRRKVGEALLLSEELRKCAGMIDSAEGLGARAAQAQALRELAEAIQISHPHRTDWVQAVVESHRRVVGNGNSGVILDGLFSSILLG